MHRHKETQHTAHNTHIQEGHMFWHPLSNTTHTNMPARQFPAGRCGALAPEPASAAPPSPAHAIVSFRRHATSSPPPKKTTHTHKRRRHVPPPQIRSPGCYLVIAEKLWEGFYWIHGALQKNLSHFVFFGQRIPIPPMEQQYNPTFMSPGWECKWQVSQKCFHCIEACLHLPTGKLAFTPDLCREK